MIAYDLKGWRKEAKREKKPVGRRWDMVVQIGQVMFSDGTVPVDKAWANMVLIQKFKG